MNLSMKWLRDYVKITVPVEKFAADMTMSGSKAESCKREGEGVCGLIIGKILEVTRHPGADSLYICKVDAGREEPLQIVTAADNVVPGAMVPVFTDGSVTAQGKKIKKGKLRGEISDGMLGSISELGLTTADFPYADENGIFLIKEECTPGQDGLSAIGLDDTVVEFEITPNRPDCLSVLGLAREAAAIYKIPFLPPEPKVRPVGGGIRTILSVRVENPAVCQRSAAAAVKNVKIGPSPRWIRERLRASGVRPINNIVDITNYVMLEYGQPMHAFDLRHVGGARIVVRNARPGETIVTLDGEERSLSPEMLVIADENKPMAVAGVMGGEFSGVYEDTQTIIFESACFFGPSVRSTAKALGMRTESSGRFEKGLSPQNCLPALKRALQLVEMLGAGDGVDGVIDEAAPQP
ncbi:MAG: phenylalanine--tRNA ligase subunit beta, partial [Oscillospiraceae bacterium]|nr:phenylalanine--tRNA ligase subunit beta [Oscillospiraceae bacterium]